MQVEVLKYVHLRHAQIYLNSCEMQVEARAQQVKKYQSKRREVPDTVNCYLH